VSFANGYVDELQTEQAKRYERNHKIKPKEFRSSTEKQIESMLSLKSDYNCSTMLREKLEKFNRELQQHCGNSSGSTMQGSKDSEIFNKVKNITSLLAATTSSSQQDGFSFQKDSRGSSKVCEKLAPCSSLRDLVINTMIEWASKEIHDMQLVEEVFSLLYRQFNEMGELVDALQRTYVLEVTNSKNGNCKFDVPAFCTALGSLRLLLTVGMGKKEETLLKDSLK